MQSTMALFGVALIGAAIAGLALTVKASAQTAPRQSGMQVAQVYQNAPPGRRPRVRIYREDERGVYPSYNPGPNAVRDCTASYVQEFRPSGTVITPRLNCFWRPG